MKERTLTFQQFITQESPCDYYQDGRLATFEVARAQSCSPIQLYDALSLQGYRRQGILAYRPRCKHCACCIPSRVRIDGFKPDRTMRKIWRRNQDLSIRLVRSSSELSKENYDLYQRYEHSRHAASPMANYTKTEFLNAVFSSNVDTVALEYRAEGKLVLTAIADILSHGISAVYAYFDPDISKKRSLGTFSILKEIQITQQAGKGRYLYLGFWLHGFPGMEYKARFSPFEVFWKERWQPLEDCESEIHAHSQRLEASLS